MKIISTLLFILISYSAQSQLSKGNLFLGGYLGLTSNKNNNHNDHGDAHTKFNSFGIAPSIGLFIKDKVAGGVAINYSYTKLESGSNAQYLPSSTTISSSSSKGYGLSFTPFIRPYFSMGSGIAFFIQANASLGFSKGHYRNFNQSTLYNNNQEVVSISENEIIRTQGEMNWRAYISPGVAFFPSKKLILELSFASLNYSGYKVKETGKTYYAFGLYYQSIAIGLAYYLRSE